MKQQTKKFYIQCLCDADLDIERSIQRLRLYLIELIKEQPKNEVDFTQKQVWWDVEQPTINYAGSIRCVKKLKFGNDGYLYLTLISMSGKDEVVAKFIADYRFDYLNALRTICKTISQFVK